MREMRVMPASCLINPASDATFKQLAESYASNGAESPAELEERLRQSYPNARVIQGIPINSTLERWYVYRDGRWVNPEGRTLRSPTNTTA